MYIVRYMMKHKSLADQLRRAVDDSGETTYRIAKDSGVPQPVLHRFMAGEQDIVLLTANKLATYLGLRFQRRS